MCERPCRATLPDAHRPGAAALKYLKWCRYAADVKVRLPPTPNFPQGLGGAVHAPQPGPNWFHREIGPSFRERALAVKTGRVQRVGPEPSTSPILLSIGTTASGSKWRDRRLHSEGILVQALNDRHTGGSRPAPERGRLPDIARDPFGWTRKPASTIDLSDPRRWSSFPAYQPLARDRLTAKATRALCEWRSYFR